METLDKWIRRVEKTNHGFTDIKLASEEIYSADPSEQSLQLAHGLFESEVHQARMLAVFLFARFAASSRQTMDFLRTKVSLDPDWRVQEILAQAFDRFCAETGYEKALPTVEAWLSDLNPNCRRAASEGPRIWTSRPYFRERPEVALRLLSPLHADPSEYVRKSVGNAIRDISRKFPELVKTEIEGWDISDKRVAQVAKLAGKFLEG